MIKPRTHQLNLNQMAKKGHQQKKARVPKKSNRVGLSTTATTPTTTEEAPKKSMTQQERQMKRLMGNRVWKT